MSNLTPLAQLLRAVKYETELKIINLSGDTLFEGPHPRDRVNNFYSKEILEADVYGVWADEGRLIIEVRTDKG